jgi:hypothetical protein
MDYPTLILQVGNSRMKWGLIGPRGWYAQGILSNADIGTLALRDWQNLPRPARVVGVNGGGEPSRVRVESQVARWRLPVLWARRAGAGRRHREPPSARRAARRRSLGAAGRRAQARAHDRAVRLRVRA